MSEYIDDDSDIDFSCDESVTYDDIKELDWNNRTKVSAKVIAITFRNSLGDQDTSYKIIKHILDLNLTRISKINNAFGKAGINLYGKKLWKAHALDLFGDPELSELLDDGDVLLFIAEQCDRLYTTVLKRGLPLEDKNASKQDEPFSKASSTMMDLLARTGKLKEARQVMLMTLDRQPDDLNSYLNREIESLNVKLSDKFNQLTPTKVTKICRALKDLIKDNYTKNYNDVKVTLEAHQNYKKTTDTELNRLIGFMLSLDIIATPAKEREKNKPQPIVGLARAGLTDETLGIEK